ncbi:MAG: capsule assembly Wzi family protein [Candidatus Glassbacteria bacterium]
MLRSVKPAVLLFLVLQMLVYTPCARAAAGDSSDKSDHSRYLPLDHPAYHYLDLLQQRGRLLSLDPSLRPYTRASVLAALDRLERSGLRGFELAWMERIRRDCRVDTLAAASGDPATLVVVGRLEAAASYRNLRPGRGRSLAGVGFGGRFSHLVYDVRFLRAPQLLRPADTTAHHDPAISPPAETGLIRPMEGYFRGDFSLADGAFSTEIFFGRLARNWSPAAERSLILSAEALSFDHLGFCLRSRHLTFSHYIAALDDMLRTTPVDGRQVRYNRFFTAHRLDVRLRDSLRFGITETTVYGGENRGFDPALMNPFTSYRLAAIQNNQDWNNNTFVCLDFFTSLAGRANLYGQFLFDDFLRDKKVQNRWALDSGLSVRDPLPGGIASTLKADLTVVSSFAYNTFQPFERYLIAGRSLGAPLGNDYWRAQARLTFHPCGAADLGLFAGLTKRGSGRIDSPAGPLVDSAGLGFPSPPVEKTAEAGVELWWRFSPDGHFTVRGGIIDQENLENRAGENRTRGFVNISLALYHDLIVKF